MHFNDYHDIHFVESYYDVNVEALEMEIAQDSVFHDLSQQDMLKLWT